MRGFVVIAFGVLAACGGGTKQGATTGTPENSSPVDCPSTAAVITRVIAADNQAKDSPAVKDEVAKRCTDDKWTAEARSCLSAANSAQALQECGYNNLTQAQQERLDKTTAALSSFNFDKALGEMEGFRDRLCACKDAACVQVISDDMTKWSQQYEGKGKEPPKLTPDQEKKAADIGEQMGKCMQTAMGGSIAPAAPLTVTGLDPVRGHPDGGTEITIKGTTFLDDGPRNAKVYFGSKEGKVVRFASDTEMVVEAPAGKHNDTVDVLVVFEPGGEMKLAKAYTYDKKQKKQKPKK